MLGKYVMNDFDMWFMTRRVCDAAQHCHFTIEKKIACRNIGVELGFKYGVAPSFLGYKILLNILPFAAIVELGDDIGIERCQEVSFSPFEECVNGTKGNMFLASSDGGLVNAATEQ